MPSIDLNCDLGEGMGNDHLIIPYISSANIACTYHAGDHDTMQVTVEECAKHGVAIGAHPSFADRPHFGRREMLIGLNEIYGLIVDQLRLLSAIVGKSGLKMHHVKPHGALYNMSAKSPAIAAAIGKAVK